MQNRLSRVPYSDSAKLRYPWHLLQAVFSTDLISKLTIQSQFGPRSHRVPIPDEMISRIEEVAFRTIAGRLTMSHFKVLLKKRIMFRH